MATILRALLKRSDFLVGLVGAVRAIKGDCRRLKRYLSRPPKVRRYLREHTCAKLQLGAGRNVLADWLNTDLYPRSADVVYLDVTRKFPFDDETFDYTFSEHLIEHLAYPDGLRMLCECYRVLKPGGRIRVSTPNLLALFGLLGEHRNARQELYIRWAIDEHVPFADGYRASFVVNNFYWDFDHLFVYDPETLSSALSSAGFSEICPRKVGESDDPVFCGLESHGTVIDEEMNRFETMVYEAVKPPHAARGDRAEICGLGKNAPGRPVRPPENVGTSTQCWHGPCARSRIQSVEILRSADRGVVLAGSDKRDEMHGPDC